VADVAFGGDACFDGPAVLVHVEVGDGGDGGGGGVVGTDYWCGGLCVGVAVVVVVVVVVVCVGVGV